VGKIRQSNGEVALELQHIRAKPKMWIMIQITPPAAFSPDTAAKQPSWGTNRGLLMAIWDGEVEGKVE
jgi:hypothetical protein